MDNVEWPPWDQDILILDSLYFLCFCYSLFSLFIVLKKALIKITDVIIFWLRR